MLNQINTVNEEQNEDEYEPEKKIKIPKKKFEPKSDLEHGIVKMDRLKIHKSFHEANLDTLYEVKEEQCIDALENKSKIKLQSPQMKFMIDYAEDNTYHQAFFGSNKKMSSFRFDYVEQEEIITEDHDENNLESHLDMRKSSSIKKLESFIDKSEAFDEQLGIGKKSMTENIIIESIKEENAEEEDREELSTSTHYQNKSCDFPISDELENTNKGCKLKYRLSFNSSKLEENKVIKESEDDKDDI